MARKHPKQQEHKNGEHNGLPDEVTIAVGMSVIITTNLQTDLDVTNRSQGEIIAISLQPQDEETSKHNLRGAP